MQAEGPRVLVPGREQAGGRRETGGGGPGRARRGALGLGEMLRVVGRSVWKVDSKCGPLGLMGKGTEARRPPPRLLCGEVWGFGMPLPSPTWALEPPWGGECA